MPVVHGRGGRGRVAVAGYRCGGCSRADVFTVFLLFKLAMDWGRGRGGRGMDRGGRGRDRGERGDKGLGKGRKMLVD